MAVLHFGFHLHPVPAVMGLCEGGVEERGLVTDGSKGGVHRDVSLNLNSWAQCPGVWEAAPADK